MIDFAATRVGLDPGTANTLLYVKGRGVMLDEPSLVTIRTSTGAIEAVGGEAQAGYGRTPRRLLTVRPIRAGAIGDPGLLDGMLYRFLRKARVVAPWKRLSTAIAVPVAMTAAERLALVESIRNAGAADIVLLDPALAAARGAGLNVYEARVSMLADAGAGVTKVAIFSRGETIYARAVHAAGDEMDSAIADYVRAAHDLIIGERTAERIKIEIGSAAPRGGQEAALTVKGRCAARGVPREIVLRAGEIREALRAPLERIASAVRDALAQVPPSLCANLIVNGMVLTGGSALLPRLDRYLSAACGLPVTVAADPRSCVVRGLACYIDRLRPAEWRNGN